MFTVTYHSLLIGAALFVPIPFLDDRMATFLWKHLDVQGPGALSHFGMTWNKDENALYVFGGATSGSTFASLTDKTWVLRDGHWQELSPAISPSRRGNPAMGYDLVRKRVVLYGGFDSARNNLNDTWEWDGETWTCMENCD